METINLDKYTDRTDVNSYISLFDQGAIRNPETNETLFPLNLYQGDFICPEEDESADVSSDNVRNQDIDFNEVKEALQEIDSGYYSFIGSDRETELKNLDNDYLNGLSACPIYASPI